MPKAMDITGQVFGNLKAIRRAPSRSGKTYWECECLICGRTIEQQTCYIVKRTLNECTCHVCGNYRRHLNAEDYACLNCGQHLSKKSQKKYCSIQCQRAFERNKYVELVNAGSEEGNKKSGASGIATSGSIRTYLMLKYNNCCQKCGWGEINPITEKVPLEIHHIDGDKKNNKEDNLELLCPNCHSLTPNYKYLNSQKYKES